MALPTWYLRDFLAEAKAQMDSAPNACLGAAIHKIQDACLWLDEMENQYYTRKPESGDVE